MNQFSKYITSNKTASDIVSDGLYDLYDANNIIGKINNDVIKEEYITIIKDGSGVGKVRRLPKNTLFIGTMGGIIAQNSNIDFIYCNLLKTDFTKEINGATIPHIYYSSYGNNEYYVPSLDEQNKIGELFTHLDNLITLHHRKYTYIFYSWEQRKLGEIGNTFTGLSGKTKEDFGHGEAKFVTYMNVFSNPIAQLNKTEPIEIDNKQNQVEYGDVFFTTSSETPDEVGMSSVWLENKGNIYLNSFCFGFRPFVKNDPYYMAYMLRSKNFRKNMILLAQGISRYNISKNGVMNIDIQLPNNQEQEKIGKLFYEIDNLITLHLSIRNKEEKRFYKIMYKNPDKSLLERVMEFDYLQCLGVVEQNLEII